MHFQYEWFLIQATFGKLKYSDNGVAPGLADILPPFVAERWKLFGFRLRNQIKRPDDLPPGGPRTCI